MSETKAKKKVTTTREERVGICNRILKEIASRSERPMLLNRRDGAVGQFVNEKKLWYIDHYTKERIYPYQTFDNRGFSPGGTMWGLINDMRRFIITGELGNGYYGYGGLYCTHWGYPESDMQAIRDLAKELGYLGDKGEELRQHKERQSA